MISRKLLFILCFLTNSAFGGAWLQEKGHGLNVNTVRFQSVGSGSRYEFNPYIEHGLSERFTIGGNAGSWFENQDQSTRTQGYGELSVKMSLREFSRGAWSVQGIVGSVVDQEERGQRRSYPMSEGRTLFGQNFDFVSGSVYINTEFGARTFYGVRGNEWRLEQTVGWKHGRGNILLGQLNGIKNWNQQKSSSEYDLLELQASYVLPVGSSWNVQGGSSSIIAGENVAYAPTYFMGLWYRW